MWRHEQNQIHNELLLPPCLLIWNFERQYVRELARGKYVRTGDMAYVGTIFTRRKVVGGDIKVNLLHTRISSEPLFFEMVLDAMPKAYYALSHIEL